MKLRTSLLAAAVLVCTAGVGEAAQCSTKFLTGVWVGAETKGDTAYCIVQFKKNGWITASSCFDPPDLASAGTLTGRFSVTKSCEVTGDFDAKPITGKKGNLKFSGTMNPKKGTMTGTLKAKGGETFKYGFVQQWN